MKSRIFYALAAPVIAGVLAIVVSSIALLISGHSPIATYQTIWQYLDSADSLMAIGPQADYRRGDTVQALLLAALD